MLKLGQFKFGKTMYSYYSGFKNTALGQFAKTGERYFDFMKLRKCPDGLYEIIKHENISALGVKTGRAISKALYYAQTPAGKAGLIGAAALTAGIGIFGLYKYLSNSKETDSYNPQTTIQSVTVDITDNDKLKKYVSDNNSLYVIQDKDNIWNINKSRLNKNGETANNARINGLTKETVKINPTKTKNNGDLIYPGDTLVMPKINQEV